MLIDIANMVSDVLVIILQYTNNAILTQLIYGL